VPTNWTDKYDGCVPEGDKHRNNGTCTGSNPPPPGYDWSTSQTAERFRRMRDALERQSRTIFYSLCEWGEAHVEDWGSATGGSWRITGDINRASDSLSVFIYQN
jgi:alpha-galactosidase